MGYIDSATIGTVIHAVFEDFYAPLKGIEIDPKDLKKRIDRGRISSSVKTKLDKFFYRGHYVDNLDNMPGEAMLIVEIISNKIFDVLNNESELRKERFTYVAGEQKPETPDRVVDWQLTPELSVRFTYSIDRIDRLSDGTLRFIDYKSGSDELGAPTVEAIFGTDVKDVPGAIFQILLYSNIYASTHPEVIDIRPEILKIFDSAKSINHPLIIGPVRSSSKIELTSYKKIPDFQELLAEKIKPIFDEETPFAQTLNISNCTYCQFNSLCNRNAPDDK